MCPYLPWHRVGAESHTPPLVVANPWHSNRMRLHPHQPNHNPHFRSPCPRPAHGMPALPPCAPDATCRVPRADAPTRPMLRAQDNRADGTLVVRGPPSVYVAVPQVYMVFLLNGDVYSKAGWVTLRRPESGPALLPLPR